MTNRSQWLRIGRTGWPPNALVGTLMVHLGSVAVVDRLPCGLV
jgi:hypothetical protein